MELHITRPGLVVPVPVDPSGRDGPTPGQARGKRWRRTSPNRFVPSDVDRRRVGQRIVEAAAGAPDGALVTGWAALNWMGAVWFPGVDARGQELPVPLAIGDDGHLARRQGVQLVQDWLFDDDAIVDHGLPITRAERSVCVAALRARSLEDTVRVIDMAAAADLVSIDELATYFARIKGRPHTIRLGKAIDLADENVWSPQEVTMRLRWLEQRQATLLCNQPIFDLSGRHLLTPDVLDLRARVAGEYNGRVHDGDPNRRRDLDREELYRVLGIEVVTMMSTDLGDTRSFERRLAAAYQRAAARGPSDGWTIEQPPHWQDTSTVIRRRAMDDGLRRIWLRHRAA